MPGLDPLDRAFRHTGLVGEGRLGPFLIEPHTLETASELTQDTLIARLVRDLHRVTSIGRRGSPHHIVEFDDL